jgi:hypothetical protein
MRPGKVYHCQDCHSSVYIKHRIIADVGYHTGSHLYCNCGFGASRIEELKTLTNHIERMNTHRW